MISLALCGLGFLLCLQMGRRSLVKGLCAVIGVGYLYGIIRANLPDGFSHLIFDASVLGLYAAQLPKRPPVWQAMRTIDVKNWLFVLIAWPAFLFLMPWQDPLIQLVGLRGSIFLLPFLLLGARLTGDDVYKLALWLGLLNVVVGLFGIYQFFFGVEQFFPHNAVTETIYRSKDVVGHTAYRIPASFSSAHAYAGTMVAALAILGGAWVQGHHGKWQARLLGAGLVMSMLAIFMSATRSNALILFVLLAASVFMGQMKISHKLRWLALILIVGYLVSGDARLQRFTTLQDSDFLAERFAGSVNLSFLELVRKFPLGNGLGGGGTSVPYFLQSRIRNAVAMENEYARILLELGVPGLLMWVMFIGWVFTRHGIRRQDMFYFGRRLAYIACACIFATGLIGTGLFTAVPMTALLLLLTGWFAVREVRFAPSLEATAAPRVVRPPAVNYVRAS